MVNQQIIHPQSIVVVGASANMQKPGGKIVKNLLDSGFHGALYLINPKKEPVLGIEPLAAVNELPRVVDLAILAIPAADCPAAVEQLCQHHQTKAFIVVSAGFMEESEAGHALEHQMVAAVNKAGATLIGPNCIGVATPFYGGIFTTPLPQCTPMGADLVSASGAMAVFILEAAAPMGLRFNQIWSVGNAAQTSVEDVLEYLDEQHDPSTHPRVKLLYFETIRSPQKLLKHAVSLKQKGCWVVAIKAGTTKAGQRAALSHTGAMAGNDFAVDALFRKAGIVRCGSRQQLATVAAVLLHAPRFDNRMAIITHAGGPAVLLTDVLEKGGFSIPPFLGPDADALKAQLYHGASAANPIDVLATGNAQQLAAAIDTCEHRFSDVGAMTVIFGSPGLFPVDDVYQTVHEKMTTCTKPIFPVFPSVVNAGNAISRFTALGHSVFTDEVVLGDALVAITHTPPIYSFTEQLFPSQNINWLNDIVYSNADGPLPVAAVNAMLDAMGIRRVPDIILHSTHTINESVDLLGFPLVAKVVGPLHKTDVGGVVFPIDTKQALTNAFDQLMAIDGAMGVQLQPFLRGHELFVGLKREPNYGHLVMFGLGGIWVESLRDVVGGLAPLCYDEVLAMMQQLRTFPLLKGMRGQKGIDIERFVAIVCKISQLPSVCRHIDEIDLNPIIANADGLSVVDARIIKNSSFNSFL